MATTDLRLDEPGTLPRPGPLGRLLRVTFGVLCLYYVWGLLQVSSNPSAPGIGVRPLVLNGAIAGLFLVSYVVNIGFSVQWKKWPAMISAVLLASIATYGYGTEGTAETAAFARALWGFELYVFSHLGLAFIVAGAIATPGCEMRAFHDLYSRISGVPTKEHVCPIGPLQPVDRWEARRRGGD